MADNTDFIVFIGGVIVTIIFFIGVYIWSRVAFFQLMNVKAEQANPSGE